MTDVGAISVTFGGNTGPLEGAGRRAVSVVDTIAERTKGAAAALGRLGSSVSTAMKTVQDRLGKASGALGALSAAFGQGESRAAKFGQAAASLAASFAAGGPWLAGITAATFAFQAYSKATEEAEIANNSWRRSVDDIAGVIRARTDSALKPMRDAVQEITDEIRNFGKTAHEIALEGVATQRDLLEKQNSTLDRNIPLQQGKVNAAESALSSANAKGVGVEAAQAAFDLQQQILTEETTKRQANVAALGEAEAAIWTLADGIGALNGKIRAAGAGAGQSTSTASKGPDAFDNYIKGVTAEQDAAMYGWRGLGETADLGVSSLSIAFDTFDEMNLAAAKAAEKTAGVAEKEAQRREAAADRLEESMAAEAYARREAAAATTSSLLSSTLSGNAFSSLGQLAGSAVGTVVAPAVGVDPLTGGAIGGIVGSLFGGLIDKLEPVITIVQTLLGGAGDLVAGLAPLFRAMIPQATALATMLGALAPIISSLLEPFTAYQAVFGELLGLLVPFVVAFASLAVSINRWIPITQTLVFLFEQIATAIQGFHDAIVGVINSLNILGVDKVAESTGAGSAAEINAANAAADEANANALIGFMDAQAKATEDNTEQLKEFNESMSNIPTGYRVPMYDSEAANGKGNGSPISISRVIINAGNRSIEEALREDLLKRRGLSVFTGGGDDDTN